MLLTNTATILIMSSIQVTTHVAKILIRYMDRNDVNDTELRTKLNGYLASPRMDIHQWWGALDELERLNPKPALGIDIGKEAELGDVGILGFIAASCETFHEAVNKMQRYQPLLHNLSYSWVKLYDEYIHIGWEGNGNISTIISNDIVISSFLAITKKLIGDQTVVPIEVGIARIPEKHKGIYEDTFNCPVVITRDHVTVKLPIDILTAPINSKNDQLRQILEEQAESILATLPNADSFLNEFQTVVMRGLENGQLSMPWLAQQLGIPKRSIYRKLSERGRSYQGLLDDLRHQLALRYLNHRTLSLTEISLILGYSEQSAFTRAFKKWTGETPNQFRKRS